MGRPIPLDFTAMWGITFIDTIVLATTKVGVNSERLISLLFHECVHICQYQQLGLHAFMERYVLGWAQNGFQYKKIPLEEHAYYLQNKFETTAQPFSVEASVQIQLHKI
jgi:hypothetical protein